MPTHAAILHLLPVKQTIRLHSASRALSTAAPCSAGLIPQSPTPGAPNLNARHSGQEGWQEHNLLTPTAPSLPHTVVALHSPQLPPRSCTSLRPRRACSHHSSDPRDSLQLTTPVYKPTVWTHAPALFVEVCAPDNAAWTTLCPPRRCHQAPRAPQAT